MAPRPSTTRRPPEEPTLRLSPTFARTVEECTLRARWLRVDAAPREVPPADEALRYGSAAHAALETLLGAVAADGGACDLTAAPWRDRADRAVEAAVAEHGPFAAERSTAVRAVVHDHAAALGTVVGRDVLGVEVLLRWQAGDTPVVGFADRVDRLPGDRVRIVDYKTGARAWTAADVTESLQFRTYAVAAAARHRWARAVEVEVALLDRREQVRAAWTRDELDGIAEELVRRYGAADARITGGPWTPTEGRWCAICEFTSHCPAKGGTPADGTWDPDLGALHGAPPRLDLDG